jgi:hypothetical protein
MRRIRRLHRCYRKQDRDRARGKEVQKFSHVFARPKIYCLTREATSDCGDVQRLVRRFLLNTAAKVS